MKRSEHGHLTAHIPNASHRTGPTTDNNTLQHTTVAVVAAHRFSRTFSLRTHYSIYVCVCVLVRVCVCRDFSSLTPRNACEPAKNANLLCNAIEHQQAHLITRNWLTSLVAAIFSTTRGRTCFHTEPQSLLHVLVHWKSGPLLQPRTDILRSLPRR